MEFSTDAFVAFLQSYQALLISFSLAQARMVGFVTQFPLFTRTNITGQIRAIFSLAIAFPIAFVIEDDVQKIVEGQGALLIVLFAKEAFIGAALGILLGIPFWGVQTAGDIIDFERGASMVNQTDPVNAAETTTSGTVLLLASLAIFVVAGGLFVIIKVVYDSYTFWPVTQLAPNLSFDAFVLLGSILSLLIKIGLIVAGPAMIVMFIVDLVLAFGSKASRSIQLGDASPLIKNLVVALMIPVYGIFLAQYIRGDWRSMVDYVRGFLGVP